MTTFNTTSNSTLIKWGWGILAAIILVCIVASCSRPAYQTVPVAGGYAQPQYAPQVVQPAPVTVVNGGGGSGHSSTGDLLTGAAIGAIGAHMLSNRNQPVQPQYAPQPQYQRPYPTTTAPAQRYIPPQVTRSTNTRGVTTTVQSRPSTYGTTQRQSISVGRPSTTPTRR